MAAKLEHVDAFTPPDLTREQWLELYYLLSEEAMRRDDDGNEGAFDASPLAPIYRAIGKACQWPR